MESILDISVRGSRRGLKKRSCTTVMNKGIESAQRHQEGSIDSARELDNPIRTYVALYPILTPTYASIAEQVGCDTILMYINRLDLRGYQPFRDAFQLSYNSYSIHGQ